MKISEGLSDFLNGSRWVAAILVAFNHLRSLLFVNFEHVEYPGIIVKGFYFLSAFGHEAVLVFFVMSGFLVGGGVIARLENSKFDGYQYAIDRVSRLYAVYFLALLLTYTLDYAGMRFFSDAGYYDGSLQTVIGAIGGDYSEQHGWLVFLGNLFMTQTILVPTFGSNGPLWSLANESWYYIAGPLLFLLIWGKHSVRVKLFAAIFLICLYLFIPLPIKIGFLVWLMGSAFVFMRFGHRCLAWLGVLLMLGVMVVYKIDGLVPGLLHPFLLTFVFVLWMLGFNKINQKLPMSALNRYFADFSYSIYLLHFPIMVLCASVLFSEHGLGLTERLQPTVLNYGIAMLVMVLSILTAWIISRFTEMKTAQVRHFLKTKLIR